MKALPSTLFSLLLVASALAQSPQTGSPILEPQKEEKKPAAVIKPPAPHSVSSETAARIGETLPKFSPPKPAPVVTATRKELPDMREIDKPRNTIIRLPKEILEKKVLPHATPAETELAYGEVVQLPPYTVLEEKFPAINERDMLTTQGKLDLAYKRHPGLRLTLPFLSNDGIALAMLEEEHRLERVSEMKELGGLYNYTDPKRAAETKRLVDETFMQTSAMERSR